MTSTDTFTLRVMSFNLRYGLANDGANSWEHRKQLVVERIRAFDPDILGVQECLDFQGRFLREQLSDYTFIGAGRDDGREAGEMPAILFKTDHLEKIDDSHFWLSDTPHIPGSKSWGAAFPRMVSWAALRPRNTSSPLLTFLNTHLDHASESARQESARLLRRRISALGPSMPVILTGDFNADENSESYHILVNSPGSEGTLLKDVDVQAPPDQAHGSGSFHGFSGSTTGPRIDWILTTGHFQVIEAIIDRTSVNGVYPSDHFPIAGVIKLK